MASLKFTIGCDEAGRGCWAGPLVACALLGREEDFIKEVVDSKELKPAKRDELAKYLKSNFQYGIGVVSPTCIDSIGLAPANALAFRRALNSLRRRILIAPRTRIVIDGRPQKINILWTKEIDFYEKGESLYKTIAGASIIAKTYRDSILIQRTSLEPLWCWDKHKGYGTKLHQEILETLGPIKGFHRFSYAPIKKYNTILN